MGTMLAGRQSQSQKVGYQADGKLLAVVPGFPFVHIHFSRCHSCSGPLPHAMGGLGKSPIFQLVLTTFIISDKILTFQGNPSHALESKSPMSSPLQHVMLLYLELHLSVVFVQHVLQSQTAHSMSRGFLFLLFRSHQPGSGGTSGKDKSDIELHRVPSVAPRQCVLGPC